MSDQKFIDGLFVKAPHQNAPDFVKAAISIKRKDLGNWLRGQTDEWINIDVKESREGKWYAAINDFKPEPQSGNKPTNANGATAGEPDYDDDIPF